MMWVQFDNAAYQLHLEYRSHNPARDGKWRKITVVVIRESEKNTARMVQTRAGYFAATKKGDD